MAEDNVQTEGSRKIRRPQKIAIALASALLLGTITLALLPVVIEWQLEKRLVEQGVDSALVDDLDFNPFTGRLIIHGLKIDSSGNRAFEMEKIGLKLRLWGLLGKKLGLDDLTIEDGKLVITQDEDGSFTVGGVPVPEKDLSERDNAEGQWEWESQAFDLRNVRVIYNGTGLYKEIDIDGVHLGHISTTSPEVASNFGVSLRADGGRMELEGSGKPLSGKPSISSVVKLKGMDVSWISPHLRKAGLDSFGGTLDVEGEFSVEFTEGGAPETADVDGSITLHGIEATLKEAGLMLIQKEMAMHGNFAYENGGTVSAMFMANGEGVQVLDTSIDRQLLSADSISVGESKLDGIDAVQVSSMEFSGVSMLERAAKNESPDDAPSHVISAESIGVRGLGIRNATEFDIQSVAVHKLEGFLARDAEGKIEITEWLGQSSLFKEKEEKREGPARDYVFRLGGIDLGDGSGATVRDAAIKPLFNMTIRPIEMHVGAFDTSKPQNATSIALNAKVGKYASIEMEGEARPLASPPAVKLTGKIEALEVQKFSAYMEDLIGYVSTQGQLDVEVQASLEDNALDADMKILLVKLKMEPVEGKGDLFSKLYDLSFDKAVSLLRDKQGNLRLRLTVQGDLSDPQFAVRDVVRQALGKAIRKGATAYFAPIGVTLLTGVTLPPGTLFLIKKLLSLATTLRFDPVIYGAMQSELIQESTDRLDKMSELLADRPKVQVAICGLATLVDLEALREGVAEDMEQQDESGETAEGEAGSVEPPSEEESALLMDLARQRAEVIKDYLVSAGGIDARRLVLCSPDIELSDKAPPRAEMGI